MTTIRIRKKLVVYSASLLLSWFAVSIAQAQVKERVVNQAKESTASKAERTVDQTIESVGDGIVNGVKGVFRIKDKKGKGPQDESDMDSTPMDTGNSDWSE